MAPASTPSATVARKAKAVVAICWRGDISGSSVPESPSSTVMPRKTSLELKTPAIVSRFSSLVTGVPLPMSTLKSPLSKVTVWDSL